MQKNAQLLRKEKKRIEDEMRFIQTKSDREANFEKKAKISLKVLRWFNFNPKKGEKFDAIAYVNRNNKEGNNEKPSEKDITGEVVRTD